MTARVLPPPLPLHESHNESEDEEDDLAAILAQIQEFEEHESERLATQLQHDWEADDDQVALDEALAKTFQKDQAIEEDMLLAQQLAEEWEEEDRLTFLHASSSASGRGKGLDAGFKNADLVNIDRFDNDEEFPRPDTALLEYRSVFTSARPCPKCGKSISSPVNLKLSFRGIMPPPPALPPDLFPLLHAPCKSCNINRCRGCLRAVSCPISCGERSFTAASPASCQVLDCCCEIRAIALFEVLSVLDREIIEERTDAEKRVKDLELRDKGKGAAQSVGPRGTGYGLDSWGMIPLFGAKSSSSHTRNASYVNHSQNVRHAMFEDVLSRMFGILAALLPSPNAANPDIYDLLPHPSILPMLALSQLPAFLGTLLCNDSVADWLDRQELFNAMTVLLRKMAESETGVRMVVWRLSEREGSKSRNISLAEWMWKGETITWGKTKEKALVEYCRNLIRQFKAFLEGAEKVAGEDTDATDALTCATALCADIISLRNEMEQGVEMLVRFFPEKPPASQTNTTHSETVDGGRNGLFPLNLSFLRKNDGSPPPSAKDKNETYAASHKQLAFDYVTLHPYNTFNFASQVQASQSSTRRPADRLHMVKELAAMSTSLPEGVWVRVDDVRVDILKILIAGPPGTPYANGLFAFDCFLPLTYPHTPPLFHLRTTGGGTVRFNPNLYDNGKVCLSLLGTWSGRPEEGWNMGGQGKSTILQVVVSIQSMILVEAPWFNEPGRGTVNLNSPQSVSYNRTIRLPTVRWAMIDWMKDGEEHDIWADIIASHFLIRKDDIVKQVQEWAREDVGFNNFKGMNLLTELQQGMERIEKWGKQVNVDI